MSYNLTHVLIVNFATSLIISFVACYFLATIHLNQVLYIGNLFGIYFLVVYGIDVLVESKNLENNYKRFLLAIACILVFDVIFILMMSFIFKVDMLAFKDSLTVIFNGVKLDLVLNTAVYMTIFAAIVMIFNWLLYLKDKKIYN